MKRTFTFLMSLFLTMGAMWAQVTSLEGFSQEKCYTFATSGRGAWAVDAAGTLFSSTGDQGLAVDATIIFFPSFTSAINFSAQYIATEVCVSAR